MTNRSDDEPASDLLKPEFIRAKAQTNKQQSGWEEIDNPEEFR